MTVADGMYQVEYLPPSVTRVKKEVIKSFSHSKRVGGYLLGRTLGVGSFAKVKEGLHLTTGEKVAVKVIDKKRAKSDNYVRKNLRREGRLLQMVRHPNVVALFEVMETDNSYYLVTELCRGGDLMDYISSKKRLPELEVTKYVRQIVLAVDYLHRLGIIHRDLKIENLLLDANKDIKLIDFGLSNSIKVISNGEEAPRAQEFCVTQCGSPAYAAPELLNHEKYGLQVDLWSIGVNMYAMLTGSLPFTVEPFNIKSLYAKMKERQMNPVPDDLSKECRDLLKRLLDPDPHRRATISEALSHPWLMQSNKPVPRSPCPNKLRTADLEADILSHMAENLGFRMGEVIKFVTCNTPSPASATYHLFLAKLNRHLAEVKATGEDQSGGRTSRLKDGKVTLHLQEMRRKSNYQSVSHNDSQPSSPTQRSRGQSATTDMSDSRTQLNDRKKDLDDGSDDIPSASPTSDMTAREETSMSRPDSKMSTLPFRNTTRRMTVQDPITSTAVHRLYETTNPAAAILADRPIPNGHAFVHNGTAAMPVRLSMSKDKVKSDGVNSVSVRDSISSADAKNAVLISQEGNRRPVPNNGNSMRYVIHQNLKNKMQHFTPASTQGDTPAAPKPSDPAISPPQTTSQQQQLQQQSQPHQQYQQQLKHPANKLLIRRGLGQSADNSANMLPTTGLKSVYRGSKPTTETSSSQAQGPASKPAVNKIMPKQYVPFRSAQDRGITRSRDLGLNASRTSNMNPLEKAHTTEGMSLQGKTLMRPNERESAGASTHRPIVIKRKLVKRHRLGDITPPNSYVIQDVDHPITTTTELLNPENGIEKVNTGQPLPSISPTHTIHR